MTKFDLTDETKAKLLALTRAELEQIGRHLWNNVVPPLETHGCYPPPAGTEVDGNLIRPEFVPTTVGLAERRCWA